MYTLVIILKVMISWYKFFFENELFFHVNKEDEHVPQSQRLVMVAGSIAFW